jgi:exopolyphosphatase/guanosine-5'-triphosphate,3'-diphosphate pyrophosphatase
MTRVAAIDCGTNSIRLLIAEPNGSGGLKDLERRLEIVRLGQGVDASGEFHPDALQRMFTAVDEYAELIKKADVPVEKVHFVATSAARDVKNRETFFAGIKDRLGMLPDVISGRTEARLSFNGTLSRVRPQGEPVLVVDIGGGSTELITGSANGEMHSAISLDIGSVRVTERFLKHNPVADDDLERAADYVDGLLADSEVDFGSIGTWRGAAFPTCWNDCGGDSGAAIDAPRPR